MVLDLSLVNIFIGQNNSGKSNILDAIQYVFQNQAESSPIYYPKADIQLNVKFSNEEQQQYELNDQEGVLSLQKGQRELTIGDQKIDNQAALLKLFGKHFKRLDSYAFLNFEQIERDYRSLFSHPSHLDKFQASLKNHFPKISADQNAMDIRYEKDGLYEGERRVTIDRMGSGFRRIFTMLLYIYHPDYSVVLINEPEIHLHPAVVKKLLWAMQNSQAGQIIFTTHSPLFITPITLPQVVRVVKEDKSTKAFALSQAKYDYQRLIQELNADNLEMFFADRVVLVEGVSDRLLFRGLIDKFYKGNRDLKVVQTHGKGNMKIYVDLLKIFKVPFTIVLDKDAIRTNHLQELLIRLNIKTPEMDPAKLITMLREFDIFILPNGDLENNYPRRYQRHDSKSTNALRAANHITEEDFNSKVMVNLREIINSL